MNQELTDLYAIYMFEKTYEDNECTVFTYNSGYFNNAEIVTLGKAGYRNDKIYNEYSKLGFSVRYADYKNVDDAHERLFEGFFRIALSNRKLLSEYDKYCELQRKKLGGADYSYIAGKYYVDGELKENTNIIEYIFNFFNDARPKLIIIEAAAGFGKTCTSFEIVKKLAATLKEKVPILAELSKSRHARIFKHVLYAEIDQKFTTLSSETVLREIRDGRIPLIIDGFDELLSKSTLSDGDIDLKNIEDAQTMLDTIAEIFCEGSMPQVLLTSRKSSIFTGDIFDEWIGKRLTNCEVIRIEIGEPTVQNWIGKEKLAILEKNNINLNFISNPVLLSIIKNTPLNEFSKEFINVDMLLKTYFKSLLEREKERQSIPLTESEQFEIMKTLAAEMVYFDISAEEPSFIKELLYEIIKPQLHEIEHRYELDFRSEDRPTDDEIVMKLVNHALLDRVSSTTNRIGFINEFIFGLLIGDAILSNRLEHNLLSEKYINIAATAYSVKDEDNRIALYQKISEPLKFIDHIQKLIIELKLLRKMCGDYIATYIEGISFSSIEITNNRVFSNCTFDSCIFDSCKIDICAFQKCAFINCKFYHTSAINLTNINMDSVFYNCIGHEIFDVFTNQPVMPNKVIDYEKIVLEQYWKPGYDTAEIRRTYRTLFRGTQPPEQKYVAEAIDSLKQKGYLIEKSHCLELNFEFFNKIKEILGR